MTEEYLVSFDTDRIKEYLFASNKLREIRGASYLLVQLEEEAKERVKAISNQCEIVFFSGGSGLVLTPSCDIAEKVVSAVQRLYQEKTVTGSITGVCLPLTPATRTNGFRDRVKIAGLALRQKKDEKVFFHLPGIEPYTQPCAACEQYPASRVSPIDQQPICLSCWKKREIFRKKINPNAPEDLNKLGEVSHPPGYVGFIYADGNNMGEHLNRLRSDEDYRNFATNLDKAIKDSVKQILDKHPDRHKTQPYERLLIGGDDLMLVTAGDIALEVACDIADKFEQVSKPLLKQAGMDSGKPLTLGIGIVLAHASFPMTAFHRLAMQLLKQAKRRCAEEGYARSAVDFMVVTAAGCNDLGTVRDEVLTQDSFVFQNDHETRLTQRPYTLKEMRNLLQSIKKFKDVSFPRSQLQFLYEGVFHSQSEAVYRWCKVLGRARQEYREAMRDFCEKFKPLHLPPWKTVGSRYSTALVDLVEIYPFIRG